MPTIAPSVSARPTYALRATVGNLRLWPIVRRKLDQIDAVTKLDDLRVPPGNRLHALVGELSGQYAVRVNDQYRIVFRYEGSDAFDVRCADCH